MFEDTIVSAPAAGPEATWPTEARVWVLVGNKLGDNSQLTRAAEAMGVPCVYKNIVLKPGAETRAVWIRPSLAQVDTAQSCLLAPPWPDLVVTAGRHLSCVALWIKRQSGGKTRVALFNPPRGRHDAFDLILAPSLYDVEGQANVMRYQFPLTGLATGPTGGAAEQRPAEPPDDQLHVLLLGGPTTGFILNTATAAGILDAMRQGHARGGRIAVVTSRRTPRPVVDDLAARLQPGESLYRWVPGDKDNPYFSLLASGATVTVTGDSISMLMDVASRGKRLVIAQLPRARRPALALAPRLAAVSQWFSERLSLWPLPVPPRRDFAQLHQRLVSQGYAVLLGTMPRPPVSPLPDESGDIAAALRGLLR